MFQPFKKIPSTNKKKYKIYIFDVLAHPVGRTQNNLKYFPPKL